MFALLILLYVIIVFDLRSLGKFIRRTVRRREIDANSSCLMLQCVWLCVCIIFCTIEHINVFMILIYNIIFCFRSSSPLRQYLGVYLTFDFRMEESRYALNQYSWLLIVQFVFQFSLSFILQSVFVWKDIYAFFPYHFISYFSQPILNTLKVDKWTPSMQKGNDLKWNIS